MNGHAFVAEAEEDRRVIAGGWSGASLPPKNMKRCCAEDVGGAVKGVVGSKRQSSNAADPNVSIEEFTWAGRGTMGERGKDEPFPRKRADLGRIGTAPLAAPLAPLERGEDEEARAKVAAKGV